MVHDVREEVKRATEHVSEARTAAALEVRFQEVDCRLKQLGSGLEQVESEVGHMAKGFAGLENSQQSDRGHVGALKEELLVLEKQLKDSVLRSLTLENSCTANKTELEKGLMVLEGEAKRRDGRVEAVE